MNHVPTPSALLERAWAIARERLDYVYVGNIATRDKENTLCPGCGELLISRSGYSVNVTNTLLKKPFEHLSVSTVTGQLIWYYQCINDEHTLRQCNVFSKRKTFIIVSILIYG